MERAPQVEQEAPAARTATAAPPAPVPALAWASAAGNQAVAALARAAADGSHGSPGVPQTDFDPRTASDERADRRDPPPAGRGRLAEGGLADRSPTCAPSRTRTPSCGRRASRASRRWPRTSRSWPGSARRSRRSRSSACPGTATRSGARCTTWASRARTTRSPARTSWPPCERLQALADEVNRALQLKLVLLQIPVGFHEETGRRFDAADPQGRKGESKPALFDSGQAARRTGRRGRPGVPVLRRASPSSTPKVERDARPRHGPSGVVRDGRAGGRPGSTSDAHAALRMFAARRARSWRRRPPRGPCAR